jgi:hypothetical protein
VIVGSLVKTSRLVLASLGLAALVALAGCGSNAATATSGATATTGAAAPVRHYPPVPAGGTDCGIVDEMSGWPTTVTMPASQESTCITQAFADGTRARLVIIHASNVETGRKTTDGYTLPAGILVTYVVKEPGQVEVITDRAEAGGIVTTQSCTGLPVPTDGQALTPTGCTPD